MDVERAIEHLLQLHAKAEARMDRADARGNKVDRRLNTMSKLMQTGMKALREQNNRINMLIDAQLRADGDRDDLRQAMKELAASQKAYFDSLRKGKNGHR